MIAQAWRSSPGNLLAYPLRFPLASNTTIPVLRHWPQQVGMARGFPPSSGEGKNQTNYWVSFHGHCGHNHRSSNQNFPKRQKGALRGSTVQGTGKPGLHGGPLALLNLQVDWWGMGDPASVVDPTGVNKCTLCVCHGSWGGRIHIKHGCKVHQRVPGKENATCVLIAEIHACQERN